MSGWQRVQLGDVIDIFDHVRVPLNATERAARQGPYPYYGAQGIIDHIDGFLFDGRYMLIPEDGENLNSRKLPIAFFADGKFWVNNHAHIVRAKPGVADDVFIKQWLNNADIKAYVTGAAQPKLSQGSLKRIALLLPPLPIQRRIASILGAYDDLIEVNQRRIALLEEIARRLFEEWFVHFRCPGSESHAIVETPDGPLPHGWHYARLDKISKVNADTIRPINAPERIGYVDISSVSRGDIKTVDWQAFSEAPGRARRRVRDGSIIWSMVRPNRRSYALIVDPEDNLIVSTGFAVLDPYGISSVYLYHYVTADAFVGYLVGNASGAAYPAVTGAAFERAPVLLPPEKFDQKFSSVADPMMRLVDGLRRANMRLAASRDLLLPRLISGELSVSAAEGELEAVA
jgi:type I restriction enzyme, S subunit